MKTLLLLTIIILISSCGGGSASNDGVSERELYGQKRVDCKSTKSTDEGANITSCSQIRPDSKELKNLRGTEDNSEYKTTSGQFVEPKQSPNY